MRNPSTGRFSNFGVLNCVGFDRLSSVAQALARTVRPGGRLALCMMGRFCLWETLGYLLRARPGKAFRRLSGRAETSLGASSDFAVYYPTVAQLRHAFARSFGSKNFAVSESSCRHPILRGSLDGSPSSCESSPWRIVFWRIDLCFGRSAITFADSQATLVFAFLATLLVAGSQSRALLRRACSGSQTSWIRACLIHSHPVNLAYWVLRCRCHTHDGWTGG